MNWKDEEALVSKCEQLMAERDTLRAKLHDVEKVAHADYMEHTQKLRAEVELLGDENDTLKAELDEEREWSDGFERKARQLATDLESLRVVVRDVEQQMRQWHPEIPSKQVTAWADTLAAQVKE